MLSQALKLLELSTVKFAKCLGGRAAVLSDLNAQPVIIHAAKKRKSVLAFNMKRRSIDILKRNKFGGFFVSLLGFALFV